MITWFVSEHTWKRLGGLRRGGAHGGGACMNAAVHGSFGQLKHGARVGWAALTSKMTMS